MLLSAVMLMAMTACGGGGGADSGNAPPPAPVPPPPPQTFALGGTAAGLTGSGLVLQNNAGDDLAIPASGDFTFAGRLAAGATYSVTIKTQPANPDQICVVASGSGTIAAANIANVAVTCSAPPPPPPPPPQAMSVTGTTPADQASGVARDTAISIDFSVDVDAATVNDASITLASPAGVKKVTYTALANHVVVTPIGKLLPRAKYTLSITPAVRGAAGETLAAAVTRTFTASDGQWGTPQPIKAPLEAQGLWPQIGFDASGNAIAVWIEFDGTHQKIAANRYVAGSGWGIAKLIAADGIDAVNPRVAVDAAGNAFAVWQDELSGTQILLNVARYVAGSGWEPDILLGQSADSGDFPQVSFDSNGNAMAVWAEFDGTRHSVWKRYYSAASGWENGSLLETDDGNANGQQVAFDKDGNAIAVWAQLTGTRYDLWARRYVAGTGWLPAEQINTINGNWADSPQIAFDANGNATVVWMQGSSVTVLGYHIWSNRYVAGSGWETATLVEKNEEDAPGLVPQIAVDPAGNALAVWQQLDVSRAQTDIWANRYVPGVGWDNEALIERKMLIDSKQVQVAMDASGNGIAVWRKDDGTRTNIWTNRYLAGTGWGIPQLLEETDGAASDPQVAIDADGNAFAIWHQATIDQRHIEIFVNRFE